MKVTPEGKVKVLDFGLAKALENSPGNVSISNSPTLSVAATNAGVILGTAAYMSPEQARGLAADARSDIFSFGCVLYEMMTGRPPFQGDTISDVLASVLKSEVDLSTLPPRLGPRAQSLLQRCLEKNPKRRWHAAADLRMEIEALLEDAGGLSSAEPSYPAPRSAWIYALSLAAVAVIASAATALWYSPGPPAPLSPKRFLISVSLSESALSLLPLIAISRDGTPIAYPAADKAIERTLLSRFTPRPWTSQCGAFEVRTHSNLWQRRPSTHHSIDTVAPSKPAQLRRQSRRHPVHHDLRFDASHSPKSKRRGNPGSAPLV